MNSAIPERITMRRKFGPFGWTSKFAGDGKLDMRHYMHKLALGVS